MKVSPRIESFVMHCGEMGSRWGFNRTIGQIMGLLVMSKQPLSANEIGETLSISRGNVSMGIKELQSWRLVNVQHIAGDRKDYYLPSGSIWELANRIFEERSKREIDPTLSLLRDSLLDEPSNPHEEYALQQMDEIHDLLETLTKWARELQSVSPEKLTTLMKLGSGVVKMLDFKDKVVKSSKH
ncbi:MULTISPECIES: GbsR/MarR family transcriptional regulator [Thalassotalea]|uniref:GbsR/MarR family transcriptional regulator n=1 Tax=Thalassotalea TaxID=1518149 RepID=UPI000943C0D6|nr:MULTISPECIES: MarR family transcriptional regulator [Thalassotalea]OKY25146.1 transcriptional regulator [Thalassotalea sp. PP2-459]